MLKKTFRRVTGNSATSCNLRIVTVAPHVRESRTVLPGSGRGSR